MKPKGKFYSGTSNLVLPGPKYTFPAEYQDKSRLAYYASLFNSVEINSSFYKIPQPATVEKWGLSVPDDFRFTFKLSRDITHAKGFIYDAAYLHKFFQAVDRIGDKKGCLLIQFPPSFSFRNLGEVNRLLGQMQKLNTRNAWKVAVEFRNAYWNCEEVFNVLAEYKAGIVQHDLAGGTWDMHDAGKASFIYLRFHGPEKGYRGSYTHDVLQQYAVSIKKWMKQGKTVYAYFNNTMGDALNNLLMLNEYIDPGI
ncbi:MAG: DUF72 domain-containing protein [Taibaiella sp.]|nr:DUF72 domain-containing protein [Taibaiella sp.]